jgi:hypothetical protein
MEDTQLTQNNSPATGPLVAKTSDGLNLRPSGFFCHLSRW